MKNIISLFFIPLFLLCFSLKLKAQCPDFKKTEPSLDGWYGATGQKDSLSGIVITSPIFVLTGRESTESIPGGVVSCWKYEGAADNTPHRFKVYDKTMGRDGMDVNVSCGNLPVTPPNDEFSYSIRLGNTCTGHEAEALYYKIPVNEDNALLFIYYAIVLESPTHGDNGNPEFIIRIKDKNNMLVDSCAWLRISSHNVTGKLGWKNCGAIVYKEWSKVAVNLGQYLGDTVTVEIMTGDCSETFHFGYAYVAAECMPLKLHAGNCYQGENDTVAVVEAPFIENGGYQWSIKNGTSFEEIIGLRGKQHTLYVLESDFDTAPANENIELVCTITSYMNPDIPCEAAVDIEVANVKPRISISTDISCSGEVTFTNESYTPLGGSIDTTKTLWKIDGVQYNTHSEVKHQFTTGGEKEIFLQVLGIANNPEKTECQSERRFVITLLDSLKINMDNHSYCIGDTAVLRASGADLYQWFIGSDILTGNPVSYILNTSTVPLKIIGSVGNCSTEIYKELNAHSLQLKVNSCVTGKNDTAASVEAPYFEDAVYHWSITDGIQYYPITGKRGEGHFLYIIENDFELFPNDGIVEIVCTMNSMVSCKNPLRTKVSNLKPHVRIKTETFCDQKVTLSNESFIASPLEEINPAKTLWKIDGLTFNTHSSVSYIFATGGEKEISLYTEKISSNPLDPVCWAEEKFSITLIDSVILDIKTNKPSFCIGDTVAFSASGADTYQWAVESNVFDGDIYKYVLNSLDVSVKLIGLSGFCSGETSKQLNIQSYPSLTIAGDTIICWGESTELKASSNIESSFIWSYSRSGYPVNSQENTYTIFPSVNSYYYVIASTKNNCQSIDSIHVSVSKPSVSADLTAICTGKTVTLQAEAYGVSTFSWRSVPASDLSPKGPSQNILTVAPLETTEYFVSSIVSESIDCRSNEISQKITVSPYPIPEIKVIPEIINIENPIISLTDKSIYGILSLWELGDGHTSKSKNFTYVYDTASLQQDFITIRLTSFNNLGCSRNTAVTLPVKKFHIDFPTAFAPDQDQIFHFVTKTPLEEYHLVIYTRWGELIFESFDTNKGWDGAFKGSGVSAGSYIWYVTYKIPGDHTVYSEKGSVFLVR